MRKNVQNKCIPLYIILFIILYLNVSLILYTLPTYTNINNYKL